MKQVMVSIYTSVENAREICESISGYIAVGVSIDNARSNFRDYICSTYNVDKSSLIIRDLDIFERLYNDNQLFVNETYIAFAWLSDSELI